MCLLLLFCAHNSKSAPGLLLLLSFRALWFIFPAWNRQISTPWAVCPRLHSSPHVILLYLQYLYIWTYGWKSFKFHGMINSNKVANAVAGTVAKFALFCGCHFVCTNLPSLHILMYYLSATIKTPVECESVVIWRINNDLCFLRQLNGRLRIFSHFFLFV